MLYNNDGYCYTQGYNITPYNKSIANYNFGPLNHKDMAQQEPMSNILDNFASTNSTIDGDSPLAESDVSVTPDGTRAPANRRDPIYTAIPGLKWKSKSKKWVVRWDNPITNRRVYKYFSGQRYGFIGAHKRAAYYLEFLNASVGKGTLTSGENPFCRRNEGPPKGKSNKGLQRKFKQNSNRNAGKNDFQHSNSYIVKNKSSELNMMEILSDAITSPVVDPQYIRHNSQNDKRHFANYPDLYNESFQNIHLNEHDGHINQNIEMGMLSYPTYVYNPQVYLNQFSEYDERFYQPLPYQDHSIDYPISDSQIFDNRKFDKGQNKPLDYLNYSECIPNYEGNQNEYPMDYLNLDDLNNKGQNDLMQNTSNAWTRCTNMNCSNMECNKNESMGKRPSDLEYTGKMKVKRS